MFIKGGDAATVELAAVAPDKLAGLTMGGYWGNIIPVTIGNMVGGILFVAVLYYMVFSGALDEPKS
jgi:formate/nitrite transporter FocA (FNT family)